MALSHCSSLFSADLGCLNTAVDVVVARAAAAAHDGASRRPRLIRRLREASGAVMCALGISLAFARRGA